MRILYIDIDSQRPDHLGCYGYHRDTSPTIDQIASEGVRFTQCYTPDAPCLPSRTAFYSGRFGIQTGVVGHGGTAAEPKREGVRRGFQDRYVLQGLAHKLQRQGYHTAMISPFGQRHSAHHFYAGFKEIHNTGKNGNESAEHVDPVMHKWFDDNAAGDDWYLHINFWDPHSPFRVPDGYGDPFEDEPLPDWLTQDVLEKHIKTTGPHSATDKGMYRDGPSEQWPRVPARIDSMENLRRWINGYDTAIRYVDDRIKWIVDKLKEQGVYEDTAIIISADHGENQGELGIYSEHGTADEATCHVPMIIKWPGGRSGQVDDSLRYNLDLAPTLMDLTGGKTEDLWDGRTYAGKIVDGQPVAEEWDELVVSQCCHVCQRSVRWDDGDKKYLYMRTYHDGFRLFPQEMLFDLAADPHEQHDLAPDSPDLCKEGAWRLARWHDAQMQKMAVEASDVTDPLWSVIFEGGPQHARHESNKFHKSPLPGYLKRLEETERKDGADALRERYAEFLPDDA